MAILNLNNLNKTIERTNIQRGLLSLSPVFTDAEKDELGLIYNQLLTIYREAGKRYAQEEQAKKINKVIKLKL